MTYANTKKSGIRRIKTEYNGIMFDSIFERETYKQLVYRYGEESVEVHVKVSIKPKTEVFKELFWSCDFKVKTRWGTFYVEAKGVPTEDFRLKVQYLELFQPDIYDRLVMVCSKAQIMTIHRKTKIPLERVITKAQIKNQDLEFLNQEPRTNG